MAALSEPASYASIRLLSHRTHEDLNVAGNWVVVSVTERNTDQGEAGPARDETVLPSENGSTMLVLPQRTQAFTFDGISGRMQR